MSDPASPRFSVLDLAPIRQGGTAAESFRETLDLAAHAETWGYHRFWLAEHHNIPGVASAATSVLIGYVAGGTSRIRVGAGGIMLPNHPPLVIAEQFGTLELLYPGRIDLGLGRAPGSDMPTAKALRRDLQFGGDDFPDQVQELRSYFQTGGPGTGVHAVPGEGVDVPIYLLGSSDFGARLAASLGLPYAFASHFAPDYLFAAIDLYRKNFQPSAVLDRPYVMVGMNIVAADTDAQAAVLFTSVQQMFLNLIRGTSGKLPPPVESMTGRWTAAEQATVDRMTRVSAVGAHETVRQKLASLRDATQADEFIVTSQIFDHAARLRSFEIGAQAFADLPRETNVAART